MSTGEGVPETNLENAVLSTLLLLEDLERLRLVPGSDNSVRNLPVDNLSRGDIDDVRQSDEVSERAHSVGTSRSGVGGGERGEELLGPEVLDTEDLGLDLVELDTESGTGGGDVLE